MQLAVTENVIFAGLTLLEHDVPTAHSAVATGAWEQVVFGLALQLSKKSI